MNTEQKDKTSTAYKEKLELAMKAFEKGCFIHSKDTGKLYTPREFLESNERITTSVYAQQNYSNMTLHYVDYLVKSKLEAIKLAQDEYNSFMTKVIDNFKLNPKEPQKKRK